MGDCVWGWGASTQGFCLREGPGIGAGLVLTEGKVDILRSGWLFSLRGFPETRGIRALTLGKTSPAVQPFKPSRSRNNGQTDRQRDRQGAPESQQQTVETVQQSAPEWEEGGGGRPLGIHPGLCHQKAEWEKLLTKLNPQKTQVCGPGSHIPRTAHRRGRITQAYSEVCPGRSAQLL